MKRITLLILIVAILLTAVFLSGCNNEKSVIHSIELYTQPTTVYLQGQDLNLNGAQLLIKYDDNSEHLVTITEDMISGYDKNLLGEQFVVIRYESEIISLPIRIVSPELVGIDIHTLPSKVNYIQGQLFNIDGCKINVDYAGGATQVVDVTEEMCNLSVIDMDVVGTQVVTVSYSVDGVQRTATFNIFIVPKVLQSMEITASPTKEIYYVGETLDLSGGEIFLSYNSGYPERVDMAEFYNDGQGNLDIQWNNTVIANRSVVNLTYHYTDPTTDDGQTIDFTATFDVTVTERDISYVEILNPTSDTAYRYQLLGTPIDLTGLLLRVTYNNGTTEVLNFTGDPETDPMQTQRVSVEGYNSNGIEYIGYQAVNLVFYYSGVRLQTTFELAINLNNKSVSGVRLILPAGTIYDENDMPCFYQDTPVYPFTNTNSGLQGWKYVMLYDNGTESDAEYDLISSMFEGTSVKNGVYFPEVGQQTWYLRYNQIHNIPFEFRIISKEIEDASIRFLDGYKTYYGFDLNVEGMMLDLQYNNGETESIYVTPSMIQQFSSDVMGEQTIKVGYSNKYTTEQGIEVEATVTLVKKVKDNYSIGFKTLPKTDYIRDEILTLDGVQINIQYDEGESASTEVIEADDLTDDWVMLDTPLIEGAVTFRNSDGWTLTAFHLSSDWAFIEIGTTQVYLSYEGLSSFNNGAGYTVTVTDPVNSIVLQGYFDSVFSGQELPLDDKNIRVNYTSGRYQIVSVTKDMVNYNPRNLLPGPRLLILSYTDPITEEVFTTEATIEVLEKALRRIEIITPPDKTEYLYTVGSSGESLDYTGLEIMFHYNNGTSDIVAVNEENIMDFSFDNFDTSVENEALEVHVVYINYDDIPRENVYEEIFDTFMIAVRDVVVSSLKWVGPGFWPVVTSEEGKDFNMIDSIVGYVIEVTYSDGLIENKAIQQFASQLEVVGYNRNTAIRQNISLVYNQNSEVSLKVEVNVIPRILDSIALIASQNIEVIENNEIDLKEYKLMLNYSNNTQEIISMTQDYIVKSAQNPGGYDKNDTTIGQRQVTISYTQNGVTRTGTYEMIVHAKQLISIGINTLPKIKYIEGEELDLNGGKVALYYDNGSQEELSMTEATTDNFYINRNKFDNNEFSGVAKLQTIYIVFVAAGQEFQTHFDVIMQDRRTPSVVFDSQNTYEFIYGDKQAPAFMIYGYSDFYQEEATTIFGASKLSHVTVKYIDVNEYNTQDPTKDYTVLPSEVGNYYIIISYDADPVGDTRDSIHNSFIYISPTNLVIEKRVVYVAIDGVEKIYGTVNPNYTISIMSEEKYRNPTMINDMPFAYNDDFYSPNFILSPPQQQSYCYDKENNLITSFLIQCNDLTGAPVDVKTSVGSYQLSISLGESYSKNYNIVFIENYFVVRPRDVLVTPMPVSVEYGDRNIVYRYTISARPGDSASGLYGTDMLTGNLSRMQSSNYNVGSYAITKGTLGNPNYNIVFINDTVSDGGANGIYVTINQRKLYIKVNSKVITYGETLPNLTMEDVTLYRNDVCTVTEGALASTDTLEMLLGATGELVFSHNLTPLSNVGKYSLTAEITGVTTGSVIDNYDVHMIQGFIEVKQKAVQVTANFATKIYGDADPVLTYTVTGDLPSGGLQGSIARQQGEYIGTYAIVIGTLSTANPNYIIDFTGASFVITSKALIARIDSGDLTKVFDGKVPSPPPFTVYQMVDGQEMPVSGTVDTSFISVRIMDARRDNGSYNLSIQNTNSNYTVSFPQDASYKYVITKLSVDVEIIIPEHLPYKGSGYVFDAYVPDNQIQRFYNSNGTVMVDENNDEIKDEISVILQFTTGSTAIYVGDYEVYVSALISANDNYKVNGSVSRTFSITPRELSVTINPLILSYGNTIEREYTNQYAVIRGSDYTVGNLIEGSSDIVNFSFKIISEAHGLDTAKNVIFNPDGTVGSYDIVVTQPSNTNYTVALANPYKYKITPKNAKITISNNFLKKNYNGEPPVITDFSKVSTLAKTSVVFTFSRNTNDGRPLGDVGVYNFSVSSTDPNHSVYLAKSYQYTISKANVTVSLRTDNKVYDGTPIRLQYSNLNVSTFRGITPVIRSFTSNPIYDGETIIGYTNVADDYANFQSVMNQMVIKFSKNIEKVDNIIFTDMSLALLRVNETNSTLLEALDYLNNNSWVMQTPGSLSAAIDSINMARSYLNAISASAQLTANENNLYFAKEMIDDAYDLIEAENTYLAFLFYPVLTTGANELASNAGNYNFVIFQNDYNKQYDYNSTLLYKINPKEVFLGVNTYSKMYGTITSNPVLGDEDYYDYETEVLVNGTRVPMTLPNFDPEFTRANPENFNAGKYDIYYVESVLLDNNYVILQDKTNYTWEFSITPATLTLQIDDTGYGDDKVYYGTKISNTVVNKWSYVSGLSPLDEAAATVGGEISLEYLMIHILSVHSVNYSACKVLGYEGDTLLLGPDVIADMNSKPSAGEYQVEATGFTSSNYIFDILPGLLKISKADIFINTDYDGNVSRTYGEKLVLSFGGFQYDDYITISYSQTVGDYVYDMYLGEDGGSFTMPTFGYDPILNPLGSPFALTAPATNEGVYPIYFDWSQSQADSLNNYNLTGIYDEYGDHIPFGSIVLRAELSFSVADANDPTHYPNTVYGEVPEMLYIYSGFKNSETQATLGFTNPDCTSLKLRNVWDSRQLTLQDFSFTETALDILSNYTLVMDTNANLTVNKRKLYVHLDKPLSVRYNAGVNVTPYISQRLIELEVPNSNPTQYEYFYYVIGGQYGYWDIAFTNKPYAGAEEADAGLGNTDTPEDIFERYTVEEGYLTYDDDGKVETLYPFYNYMVKHNLVYEAKIGEGMTIQLDGLNFITTGENYDVVYDPTTLNVYGQLNSFIMEENIIVIEGDEINDLAVQAVYEDGTHYTYTIAELNALSNATVSTEPDSLTTILNKNDEVEITFSRTYHLTDFVDRDIVEDVVYQLRKDASFEVQFGDSQGSTVVTRKYDTVTSSNMATLSGYNYRSMRDTTGYTSGGMYYLNGPNAGYDYVDTTLRLVPTQAAHGFALYFGGGVIGGTSSLVFQGENGTYQIVMGSPSHAYAVNSGGIDLFDGYSHNIRIYFNKQYKMVYLFIDGYACSAISVEDFEFDENESSKQSIGFYGTQAWVRHLVTGYKGYYDRLATQVKVVENTPLTYYITSGTGKDLTMYDIMASSGVPEGIEAPDYTYQYYVNGLEVGGGVHTFTQGSHKVEMLIRDGANTVDSRTVPIYVTYASESASVSEIVEGSATLLYDNITQSNPATIRSYTPNATDPDLMDNETAEYHTYRLNGSNPDYTSISLSFKMQVARKADGEYRLTNAKTYVALWGNNTSRAPGYSAVSGYYGIGLSYEYNHVNNIQITQLHVTFGTTEYSEIITGFGGVPLDWLGGNEYTVQLYVDKQDSSHYGGAKVKVLLYNGSSLEYSKTVEQGTVFEDGSVSSDNINGLISASACKASIISRDTIIKISRALYNAENKTKNDYLINGTYTQSGYNGITVDGNAQVHISTNLATHSVNKLGESSLRFRFTESAVAADVNLRFMLASTDANIVSFNSVYVEYIGADQALYFYFVEDGTIYKKQFLANLNLVDGATHTIVATLNTNRRLADSTNNLDGLLASRADVSPKTVYYQTWAIMIDGQETQGIMPYYNATAYWIRNNGSNSIGQTPPSSGDTFMDNYIYCALELSNAPIYLYGLESRAKQTSEYLG